MRKSILILLICSALLSLQANGQIAEVVFRNSDYTPLSQIYSIAIDNIGNIYLAGSDSEFDHGSVIKITPFGQTQELFHDGIAADGFLSNYFSSIKFDSNYNIYVQGSNNSIYYISQQNEKSTVFNESFIGNEISFDQIQDYEIDDSGNIYIADAANSQVLKVSPDREINVAISPAGIPGKPFGGVRRLARDSMNNIYAASMPYGAPEHNAVFRLSPSGDLSTIISTDTANFERASGITVDSFDNIFVPDRASSRIFKITRSGEVSTHFVYTGDAVYLNEFPIDNWGNAYLPAVDSGIYRLNHDKTLDNLGTVANTGLYNQSLDSWGNLYVTANFASGDWVYRISQPSAAPPIPQFDPETGLLSIPYLNIGNGVQYSNVELMLNPSGSFEVVHGQEISINAITEYFSALMQANEATVLLCTDGEQAVYDGDGVDWKAHNFSCK